jgi:hypothetical protein
VGGFLTLTYLNVKLCGEEHYYFQVRKASVSVSRAGRMCGSLTTLGSSSTINPLPTREIHLSASPS